VSGTHEVGAEIEEVVLDAAEHRVEVGMRACRMQPGEPDAGVGLVHRPVGFDPKVILQAALAAAQSRRAVIAGARVDLVELDHLAGLRSGRAR
jgi:hypothetical protein